VTIVELPTLPALVEGTVAHTRRTPLRHDFDNRVYQWLVDVDQLPVMPRWLRPFSTFNAADHIGDPLASIHANIEAFCANQGVDVSPDRIVMLANAPIFGHTFDPLSVFWCISPAGALTCIVAEVHNTHGERHAYLLQPDEAGRAHTEKTFYVSPFFTVDGNYDLQFTLGPNNVGSSVVLAQGGSAVFAATFDGKPEPATRRRLATFLIKMPLMTHRVSVLIRIHGTWLWLRRLPVVKRPAHRCEEDVK